MMVPLMANQIGWRFAVVAMLVKFVTNSVTSKAPPLCHISSVLHIRNHSGRSVYLNEEHRTKDHHHLTVMRRTLIY